MKVKTLNGQVFGKWNAHLLHSKDGPTSAERKPPQPEDSAASGAGVAEGASDPTGASEGDQDGGSGEALSDEANESPPRAAPQLAFAELIDVAADARVELETQFERSDLEDLPCDEPAAAAGAAHAPVTAKTAAADDVQ